MGNDTNQGDGPVNFVPDGWTGPVFYDKDEHAWTTINPAWEDECEGLTEAEKATIWLPRRKPRPPHESAPCKNAREEVETLPDACPATAARREGRILTRAFDSFMSEGPPTPFGKWGLRSTQYAVLALCWKSRHETLNITRLANELSVERSTLSRALKRLAKRGLIELVTQGRNRIARVTKAGSDALVSYFVRWRRAYAALFFGIDGPQDTRAIQKLIERHNSGAADLIQAFRRPHPNMIPVRSRLRPPISGFPGDGPGFGPRRR